MIMNTKIGFVRSLFGTVILSFLIVPIEILGYGNYIWMLFTALMLFFALGADMKKLPSMVISFICGVAWWVIGGILTGIFMGLMPAEAAVGLGISVAVFAILFIHEVLLGNTIVGTVPAIFLGFALTAFALGSVVEGAMQLTPFHVIGIFLYGVVVTIVLVVGGFAVCSAIFGKEATVASLPGGNKEAM
jgi:hypothetical protein